MSEHHIPSSASKRDVEATSSTQHAPHNDEPTQLLTVALSIVTNSHLLSEGLISLLQMHLSLSLVGIYTHDKEMGLTFPNPAGHIVLIDSSMGRTSTIEMIQRWRKFASPPQVIVLELANDVEYIVGCIEAGASGYTLQGSSAAEVARRIRQVRQGLAQCSPEVTAQLFDRLACLSASQLVPRVSLTPREMDILACIARGYSNKEIARELVIEIRTVKHHVHNILDKLKVQHRWDAARLAVEQGWLSVG